MKKSRSSRKILEGASASAKFCSEGWRSLPTWWTPIEAGMRTIDESTEECCESQTDVERWVDNEEIIFLLNYNNSIEKFSKFSYVNINFISIL